MEERTRAYLRGRFGDYYRRTAASPPPDAASREWGYIPWTSGPDTTMIRHRSLLDLGDLGEFLARERPRHVYFSAGRYDDPGAGSMSEKGWLGSDLVFDLDADHLPGVDPAADRYASMLSACKAELQDLLSFLREDFGFRDLQVVFSGGRGYHVHVRDDRVQAMESDQRREVVDYVRGTGLDFEALISEESAAGTYGRKTPGTRRTLPADGGWGRRVHDRLTALVDDLLAADRETALERLQAFDEIGEKRAEAALNAMEQNRDAIAAGNVDVHNAVFAVARRVAADAAREEHAHIDEPVTTDVNRLIRLPGSLHGGTGLVVRPLDPAEIDGFDPLTDAVADTFRGREVRVDVHDGGDLEFEGQTFTVADGVESVPEYVAVFLMARGRAEKARE
ncbi:MAG: DNA primase small subunit PriS [Halobacteriaceae archaeon]